MFTQLQQDLADLSQEVPAKKAKLDSSSDEKRSHDMERTKDKEHRREKSAKDKETEEKVTETDVTPMLYFAS